MNRDEVLNSLTQLDFMAVDLGLYLNTHPEDTEAINAYNQVITAADTVRAKYEEAFGPLCSFRSYATDTNGKIILGLGNLTLIIPLQERSVNKCGYMKKN